MTEPVKLTSEDICRHAPKCECKEYLCVTVPDYVTYVKAYNWLRDERKYTLISAEGVFEGKSHTGAFRFKFLCEQECVLFALRWK